MRGALQQAAAAVGAKREDMRRAGAERDLRGARKVLGAADENARLGIADEIFDLCRLVGAVERQVDIARPQHRQVQQQGFDRLVGLHCHPRARWQV